MLLRVCHSYSCSLQLCNSHTPSLPVGFRPCMVRQFVPSLQNHVRKFHEIIRKSDISLSRTAAEAATMNSVAKKSWWANRRNLNSQLEELLMEIQSQLFGPVSAAGPPLGHLVTGTSPTSPSPGATTTESKTTTASFEQEVDNQVRKTSAIARPV